MYDELIKALHEGAEFLECSTPSKKVGRTEWGTEPGKRYFVLTILSVKEDER